MFIFVGDCFAKVRLLGADTIYATNRNRQFCRSNNIITGFVRKGRAGKDEKNLKTVRKVINVKRSTEIEGAFGIHFFE